MLYIGVDLGTSAVKLLLMDESGKVLNIVKGVSNQLSKAGLVRAESM